MARPVGSQSIKGWQEHELLRDLALGEESPDELAAKYDRPVQTIYDFRWRNKHRINVVLAEWSDQFSDLWSVKKHARMADLQYQADTLQELMNELKEDAAAATETMRRVDPDASRSVFPLANTGVWCGIRRSCWTRSRIRWARGSGMRL